MAAQIRVSSVMCWFLSRGTSKWARTCKGIIIICVCKAMTQWNAEMLPYSRLYQQLIDSDSHSQCCTCADHNFQSNTTVILYAQADQSLVNTS